MAAVRCPLCSLELAADQRFCSGCGAALTAGEAPTTGPWPGGTLAPLAPAPRPPDAGRFPPGRLLANRYRIVGRIGRGGMGEVYRADDLRLGGPVALKFLPASLSHDPDRLQRLHHEVRVARQVTHPNVCRVFDIAEADGESFLTMEYIDGQTLAALLRQAGRLPPERGVEIARQLCQGLAAAHDLGIIHRDLKPPNVMLDARGRVKITDFGLAAEAENIHGSEVRHGTPAYMAPEQLLGHEVSVQSDLFSLGLVLYEMFTGRHAFPARSAEEVRRLHEESSTSRLSSQLRGLDPAVERVILRCLERDPRNRPRSAEAVLAALPGGDPLAAALAIGETPSPEMVANASVEGRLRPAVAAALLASVLLIVAALAGLAERVKFFRRAPAELTPDQLTLSARQALRKAGWADPPADSAWGFGHDVAYQQYLNRHDVSSARWEGLTTGRPPIYFFWYRQSPYLLEPSPAHSAFGAVTPSHPPLAFPGMVTVYLDPQGRLVELHAVPAPNGAGAAPADWAPLFDAAGLDLRQFRPADPLLPVPLGADERRAWEGAFPDRPDVPARVEAAAARGRPTLFFVSTPGRDVPRLAAVGEQPNQPLRTGIEFGFILLVVVGGGVLAYGNIRRGRADLRGGLRLGLFVFALTLAAWLLRAHHVPAPFVEYALFLTALGLSLFTAAVMYVSYAAAEPHVRRRWPWRIVSWNRLLDGRWRDPLVGRDVLLGCLLGALATLLSSLQAVTCELLGLPSDLFFPRVELESLSLARWPHFVLMAMIISALGRCLSGFAFFFLLFLLCRREWLAGAVLTALWALVFLSGPDYVHPVNAAFVVARCLLVLTFLLRFGLLMSVVFGLYWNVLAFGPITYDLGAWYAGTAALSLALLVALPVYGFVMAKAGQPLFAPGWLEGNGRGGHVSPQSP